MKTLIRYLLPALLALAACSEDPEPVAPPEQKDFVKAENKQLVVEHSGGTFDILIESSGTWTATPDGKVDGWCKLDRRTGPAGKSTLHVSVAENSSYDERNAAIFITCGKARDVVTVTQKYVDALILTSNKVEVGAGESVFTVQVKTNVDVSYEIDEEAKAWIEPADPLPTRSFSQKTFRFKAMPNTGLSPRQGGILIKSEGGLQERVTVYQSGEAPVLVLNSRDKLVVDSEGETLKLEVKTNVDYELLLPDVDWIRENKTRSVSTYTYFLDILPNEAYDAREARLVVRAADASLADTVLIHQMQKGAIIVAKNSYEVSGEENILSLRMTTSVDIETEISVPWITRREPLQTRGLEEKEMLFRVEKNPSGEERRGEIGFTYKNLKQKVEVVQAGRKDNLRLEIVHGEQTFAPLQLWGSFFAGAIEWGDGTSSDLFQGHEYSDSRPRTVVLESMGIDSFRIENLNTVSSITIYCDDWEEAPSGE